jgi:diguanylate cyclase (GGDEF)-like protein
MSDFTSYKKMTDQVVLIGPFSDIVKDHQFNNYMLIEPDFNIIIDLPSISEAPEFLTSIEKEIGFKDVNYLIISITTPETFKMIELMKKSGFKGKIITNQYFSKYLAETNVDILTIESLKYKITLNASNTLKFVPVRFLPFPEMFLTYSSAQSVLFSSTLFSSYSGDEDSIEDQKKSMIQYHQMSFPSSEYLKNPLKEVKKLNPKMICPLYGNNIRGKTVEAMFETLSKLEFYNTYHVIKDIVDHQLQYNFIEIINHMLTHLQSHFSTIDILDAFVGSAFTLSSQPLELKRSKLDDFKMWHAFFEHMYAQKGISWLSILEPIVNKYVNNYGIEKPKIYQSLVLDLTMQSKRLEQQNQELEENLKSLDDLIKDTQDRMNRCPITSLYNQEFFREVLVKDFDNELTETQTRSVLLVQIDQLEKINQNYGKKTGDETIRNLKYILEQSKKADALLFKQKGPGIFIYENMTTHDMVQACALKIRNLVEDSNLFIEKVTVSISVVTDEELNQNLEKDAKIDQLFKLLEQGIQTARRLGTGEIVDKSSTKKQMAEGVILLVDEDEINRNMIYRIFKRVNYDVIIAKDVHDAIELIEKHPIDVIISEINLTKIDGFTLKQMFNESMTFKKIPFIMVSHSKTLDNIKRGNTLDVDLILEKPIIPEELIGHVKRFRERMKAYDS